MCVGDDMCLDSWVMSDVFRSANMQIVFTQLKSNTSNTHPNSKCTVRAEEMQICGRLCGDVTTRNVFTVLSVFKCEHSLHKL